MSGAKGAAASTDPQLVPPRPDSATTHVWRIYKTDGLDETVVASECHILTCGVLSFRDLPTAMSLEGVLVRAFAAQDWHDVKLVYSEPLEALIPRRS